MAIKKEIQEILNKIPEDKQSEATLLTNEMSFTMATISKLKKKIRKEGPLEKFEQGSQNFMRESPALKSYNQLMKTYDTLYKNLISLVPKDYIPFNPEDDDFDEFNK